MNKAMIYIREIVMKFSKETKEIIEQTDFLNLIETELSSMAAIGNRIENIRTSFPKKCSKCGKVFVNMEAFNRDTDKLPRGRDEVCYVINREVKIYKFRNCPSPCHSTLVTVCDERRDTSFNGRKRRQRAGRSSWIAFRGREADESAPLVASSSRGPRTESAGGASR